jgi:hypothetical protein
MKGRGQPRQLAGVWVEQNFFQMLGVHPLLGRLFTPEESVQGGRPVVLLNYGFWQREFAANPGIVGQAITLNDVPITVVGVLPSNFDFGSAFHPGLNAEIFEPAIHDLFRGWGHMLTMIAVLKPGVNLAQAQSEMNTEFTPLIGSHPEWATDFELKLTGLKDHVSGKLRRSLIVLWCAVGVILLIACVNLSCLLLARAAARSKELAMRAESRETAHSEYPRPASCVGSRAAEDRTPAGCREPRSFLWGVLCWPLSCLFSRCLSCASIVHRSSADEGYTR